MHTETPSDLGFVCNPVLDRDRYRAGQKALPGCRPVCHRRRHTRLDSLQRRRNSAKNFVDVLRHPIIPYSICCSANLWETLRTTVDESQGDSLDCSESLPSALIAFQTSWRCTTTSVGASIPILTLSPRISTMVIVIVSLITICSPAFRERTKIAIPPSELPC